MVVRRVRRCRCCGEPRGGFVACDLRLARARAIGPVQPRDAVGVVAGDVVRVLGRGVRGKLPGVLFGLRREARVWKGIAGDRGAVSVAPSARRVASRPAREGKRRGARAERTVDAGQAGERIDRRSVVGGDVRESLELRAARLDAPTALGPRGHLADDESRTRERVASVSLGTCDRGESSRRGSGGGEVGFGGESDARASLVASVSTRMFGRRRRGVDDRAAECRAAPRFTRSERFSDELSS